MAVTVIGRWFWVDVPSLYRFVIEGTRFAAVDPSVIVHPGFGTYPMVKFAGSFPVFSKTTSEDMAVPGPRWLPLKKSALPTRFQLLTWKPWLWHYVKLPRRTQPKTMSP